MTWISRSLALVLAAALAACNSASKTSTPNTTSYSGHGAASLPSETIAKFAPPPLAPDLARQIQSMIDVRATGLGLPTPDGNKLYFGWAVSGVPQVWRVDRPLGFPTQMTGGSDRTTLESITPNGDWLILARDRNGEENPGLYLQRAKGGELREIFHKRGVRASLQWINADGKTLYYSANDKAPDSYVLYRYDLSTGQRTVLFDEPGLWSIADVRDDGLILLRKATGSLMAEFYLLRPNTRSLEPLLGQGEKENYEMAFSARRDEYLVLTNKFGDFRRLYRFSKNKFDALTPDAKMDVDRFTIDDSHRHIVINWNDNGFSRVEAFDARTYQKIAMPKIEGALQTYSGLMSRNGRFVTLAADTGKAPRLSYVYDFSTKRLTQWLAPSSPEIDTTRFAQPKLEYYPARDGTKIPIFVRRPASCKKPCPVIIDFHGGPEAQSRPDFSPTDQLFVDAGFILVQPNVRGSDGYGKAWLASDNGANRLNVITDIEDAALHIRKAWAHEGKAPRIGVMGGSYGGYSTLYAMTKFAGSYDAGVAVVGMSNLITFLQNTAPYRRSLRITEYGDPEKDRKALVELSPITFLDKVRDPVLIIQGVSDPRVPAGEAVQMYEAMKRKGLDSQLILFADEGHGSVKRENRVLEIGHALAFFKRQLTEPMPVHSNQ